MHSVTQNISGSYWLHIRIEAITAEMLAVCHTHIAIADNMSSMGLSTKAVNTV